MPEVVVAERQIETSAGQTRVLIYKPKKSKEKKLPVFVNTHGGGFIQGSAEDDEVWCRNIVEAVGCSVVSIDYHLSPEYKFPVALEECYDVLKWAHAQADELGFDSARIAVGGHSAGGNFAAALCLMTRDRHEFSIVYQILNYPPLDFSADPFLTRARDTLLTAKAQAFFTACYLPDKSAQTHPLASPLLATDLAGLPPALIIAAEYDPLRVEEEKYAKRLEEAGVDVTFKVFEGCMHAFTHFGQEPAASQAWALIHEKLRQAFAPSV
jgi:acetyl esterase